jgi:hypothetical protein
MAWIDASIFARSGWASSLNTIEPALAYLQDPRFERSEASATPEEAPESIALAHETITAATAFVPESF